MNYIFLLLIPIIICLITIKISKRDFLSPTFITCICFIFAIICSCVGLLSWNSDKHLSYNIIILFAIGLISFALGEYIIRFFQRKKKENDAEKVSLKLINIPRPILILMLCFIVITSFLLFIEIKKYCLSYGYSTNSFSKLMAFYRTKTGLFNDLAYSSSVQINFIVKQMQKICNAINLIVFTYGLNIFFINKTGKQKNKKNIFEYIFIFIIITTCLFQTIMFNGGRSILFHFALAYFGLFLFYYFYIYKFKLNKGLLFKGMLFLAIIAVSFYLLLPIVGRKTKHNPIVYTSFSFGTAIPSLDLYLKKDNSKSKNIGEESFRGVYYTLNKLKIIKYSKAQSHEWYHFAKDGSLSSNTFTSFRSYYKDFGYIGLGILQFVFGMIMYLFYSVTKNKKNELSMIIYFYYFYILFDQIRDEQFYSLINISTIANIFLIVIIYYALIFIHKRGKQNGKIERTN